MVTAENKSVFLGMEEAQSRHQEAIQRGKQLPGIIHSSPMTDDICLKILINEQISLLRHTPQPGARRLWRKELRLVPAIPQYLIGVIPVNGLALHMMHSL